MDNNKRLEGEEIQKGLESFLDQELDLSLAGNGVRNDYKENPAELDLSLANNVSQPPKPAQRKRPEQGTRPTQGTRTASSKKPVSKKKQDAKKKPVETSSPKKENVKKEKTKKEKPIKEQNKKVKRKKAKQKRNDKTKQKKNRFVKFVAILSVLFVIGFVGLYILVGSVYSKMNYKEIESVTNESMKEDGVINVLLIGNDSRSEGEDGRSDAMILVSISDKTKTITMTSLLRDMYVEIPGHGGNRLNAAYSYGGPELLMETIEYNFDIPVHRYALVNFQAFANLVDAVGGVDLELTNEEVQYVNGYLMEYNQLEGRDLATDFLDPSLSGMIHLNGPQALAYTRNRYIGTDFGRTERQRKVLGEVFGKLPGAALSNGGEVIDGLFPNLTTNLEQNECFSISLNAWKIVGYDMVQQAVPVEGTYSNANIRGMAVLEVDYEVNRAFLQETLYGK